MPTPITKEIDKILRDSISPALLGAGFSQTGRAFHRDRDNAIQVIGIQLGKRNKSHRGRFTINLGVFFPAVARMLLEMDHFGYVAAHLIHPEDSACQISSRLGHLTPEKRDIWWVVHEKANSVQTGEEIRYALVNYGLPWLDESMDLRNLIGKSGGMIHICALLLLGEKETAAAKIREYLSSDSILQEGLRAQVKIWGEAHRLYQPPPPPDLDAEKAASFQFRNTRRLIPHFPRLRLSDGIRTLFYNDSRHSLEIFTITTERHFAMELGIAPPEGFVEEPFGIEESDLSEWKYFPADVVAKKLRRRQRELVRTNRETIRWTGRMVIEPEQIKEIRLQAPNVTSKSSGRISLWYRGGGGIQFALIEIQEGLVKADWQNV